MKRSKQPKQPSFRKLPKTVDEVSVVRCAVGQGIIREEVWTDDDGKVIRYNLAFINHQLFAGDNGRVLGYDTAHGGLHRHFAGKMEYIKPATYTEILDRFIEEVNALKKVTKI